MKKLIALLLVLAMVLSLVACGETRTHSWDDDDEDEDRYEDEDDRDRDDDDDDRPAREEPNDAPVMDAPTPDAPPVALPGEMQTQFLLVDDGDFVFQIDDIDPNGYYGYTMTVYCQNNTDTTVWFNMENVSINDRMCDPYWSTTLEPGTYVTEEIIFYESYLQTAQIGDVTGIEFQLTMTDSNDWSADPLSDGRYVIYPYGEEYFTPETYRQDKDDTVLIDNSSCYMAVTEYDPRGDWGYTMTVYCENRTSQDLDFDMGNVSVNGLMFDPYFYETVAGGKSGMYDIYWYEDDLEEMGIKSVNDICLDMMVTYADDWYADPLADDSFVLFPEGGSTPTVYAHDFDSDDILLWEDSTCAVYIVDVNPDYDWGYGLQILAVNKTDKNLSFYANEVLVNGWELDPYWGTQVAAGKSSLSYMYWYESDFEEYGFNTVGDLNFELQVYDSNDWYADDLVRDTIGVDLTKGITY